MTIKYHLYSSEGCHLCEQAYAMALKVIEKEQIAIIDIVEDTIPNIDLVALYGVKIPVLEKLIDGRQLFWPFEQQQIVDLHK